MDEQDPRRGLEAAAAVEIGCGCLEQRLAGCRQRTLDPVDQGPTSGGITSQNSLDQQLVGKNRSRCVRPGPRSTQAREGGPGRASCREKVRHGGADDQRALTEAVGQRPDCARRVLQTPQDGNQPSALDRRKGLDLEARRGSP